MNNRWKSVTIVLNVLVAVALAVLGVLSTNPDWTRGVWVAAAIAGCNALNRWLATPSPNPGP